jgi:diguanylate cyclase (GGDEF)-like protein/PAS domain S-box-containing protein
MQAILDSVKDLAILSTDVHGYVIKNSAGAEAVFRIPRQEILGQDVLTLFANPKYQHELARFMSTPDIPTLERNRIPQTIQTLDRFLDMTVQRVYDPEKHTIGFLFIARDVTDTVLLQEKLEALTITDELTGLYNQRSFFSTLGGEIERARRVNSRLSLCLFDLDSFKKFNDTHGHLLGSQVLKETADLLRRNVRSNMDSCYRYGGDEFIVIMSHTPASAAMVVAERVRVQLHEHFRGQISASLGIAEYSEGLDARKLMVKADQAMYAAKQKGGNQIVIAE